MDSSTEVQTDACGWRGIVRPREVSVLSSTKRIKVALFLRNFRIGGAETQALELASHLDRGKFELYVIALHGDGILREQFERYAAMYVLTGQGVNTPFSILARLIRYIRRSRVQIVHSFLYATNFYSLLAKLFVSDIRVIIGLRDALEDPYLGDNSWLSRTKFQLLNICLKTLMPKADSCLSNSDAGKRLYENRLGVEVKAIANGVDTDRFTRNPSAAKLLRLAAGVSLEARVVGMVANCTAYKDYPAFVRAAKVLASKCANVHFVSIGEDRTEVGASAKRLVTELGLESVFHFLGTRSDLSVLMPGLDVLCSASVTEGFSNSIAEAMACGVPCVVTDVGDSKRIVGENGIVVPARNAYALATGIEALLNMCPEDAQSLRLKARERIVNNFGVKELAIRHEHLYESLCFNASPAAAALQGAEAATSHTSDLQLR